MRLPTASRRGRAAARRGALARALALAALALLAAGGARAGEVHAAVATSFAPTARALAEPFRAASGHALRVSDGSSGKLYAQIAYGAPYEVFLSADAERPRRLEEAGHAVAGTRFAYALGRLVLWSADPARELGPEALRAGDFTHLAIASPELAPYGAAARETLRRLGLWEALAPRLVRGEDVGQAYQFVATGNAELGFVVLAQLTVRGDGPGGARWLVPAELHAPIEQHAVLLARGRDAPAARAFLDFLRTPAARARIAAAGYDLPPGAPAGPGEPVAPAP